MGKVVTSAEFRRRHKPKFATAENIDQFWRNAKQLSVVRGQITAAINASTDGAYAMLDIKTARNMIEVCLQAEHTEKGHGQ